MYKDCRLFLTLALSPANPSKDLAKQELTEEDREMINKMRAGIDSIFQQCEGKKPSEVFFLLGFSLIVLSFQSFFKGE